MKRGRLFLMERAEAFVGVRPGFLQPHVFADDTDDDADEDADEYALSAEFNYPSSAAVSGAGFKFLVTSGGCTSIPFVEPGAPWTPDQDPEEALRGFAKLCNGCL